MTRSPLAKLFPGLAPADLVDTGAAIRVAFSTMAPADREALRAVLYPETLPAWRRRAAKRSEYHDALFALAATYAAPSGHALAQAMRRDLARPSLAENRRRPLLDRILAASAGKVPSARSLRRTLGGVGQKNMR